MDKICPICGAKSSEKPFVETFCIECRPSNIKLPKKIMIEKCNRCGNIKLKGGWIPFSDETLDDFVASKCKGEFESATYNWRKETAYFMVGSKDVLVRIEKKIPFEFKKSICTTCSRRAGGYFEGIIQLRGKKGKVKYYARFLKKQLSKTTFIAKEEDLKEGIDIYVGESKPAIVLLRDMNLKPKITRKLHGQKAGKRLYRTTFLLRF